MSRTVLSRNETNSPTFHSRGWFLLISLRHALQSCFNPPLPPVHRTFSTNDGGWQRAKIKASNCPAVPTGEAASTNKEENSRRTACENDNKDSNNTTETHTKKRVPHTEKAVSARKIMLDPSSRGGPGRPLQEVQPLLAPTSRE